nr:hypothetical protein B0A51_03899 [Rachicladosporium sp. CCFEE 5018]
MARSTRLFVTRRWRMPKAMLALMVLEFPLTVAALALFGIADPNLYRTKLWQNGADQGFNSSPIMILYAFANYKPIAVPLVWSSFMTTWNVIISVLSMFILLVKSVMWVMHIFIPLVSLVVHGTLIALYAIAIRNQSAPDLLDPDHPAKGLPWYLSKGCSYATQANKGYCMQARASFGVTCVMLALWFIYFLLSLYSLIPTTAERTSREADIELRKLGAYTPDEPEMSREAQRDANRQLFLNLPKTPTTPWGRSADNPMTPRTVAFTQLNGGSNGNASGRAGLGADLGARAGPRGGLPFREQWNGA